VFVANPSGTDEDDGWVMSYVYQPSSDTSAVLILNAQDIAGEPAAVIELPVRVPAGFHGNWVADDD
jgi:carotenoid cleavage dioxygenase